MQPPQRLTFSERNGDQLSLLGSGSGCRGQGVTAHGVEAGDQVWMRVGYVTSDALGHSGAPAIYLDMESGPANDQQNATVPARRA